MKRTISDRSTHILAYGLNFNQWQEWKGGIKGGLQSMHMGWRLTSFFCTDADTAVAHIEVYEDLEIIFFDNQIGLTPNQLSQDAVKIAQALSRHKHKPCVVFGSDFHYLEPVFQSYGIEIKAEFLEYVANDRWMSQIP